jgi:hypothetical protein
MAHKEFLGDRRRKEEEEYFRRHEAQVIENLRQRGTAQPGLIGAYVYGTTAADGSGGWRAGRTGAGSRPSCCRRAVSR